ncbi:hypothetical protein [Ferrimonas balearica]|uniref:hypothetical protein n=1 Tax=Ferrimonas balearica TaxID=44012 RepID=UPI001C993835|nr:hypothetical protein [Ferrimonas balearica]MBY5920409.1 hypothetical protein [Ferrimonas balearica]MBY5996906.1 hypothetical protein [Ferrimonas balearica]
MANPAIGKLRCNTCDDVAEVRQQCNGERLLYTICPNCGMDRRSGAKVQAMWREQMVGVDDELPEGSAESGETPENTWLPDEQTCPESENQETEKAGTGTWVGLGIATVLAVGLAFLGVRYSGGRG